MSGSHIRLNRATREWVIYSPVRRKRPQEFQNNHSELVEAVHNEHQHPDNTSSDHCPFCQPDMDESILLEIPDSTGTTGSNWLTRIVQNKYPALSPDVDPKRSHSGIYMELPGYGHHEMVIESPDHNQTLATMSLEAVTAVIESYHQRYLKLIQFRKNLFIMIFRNHGKAAGASLHHPHSQIIATPIVPRRQRWLEDEAQRYFDEWGTCAYCDMLEFEMSDRHRVIATNDEFLAFIPYAAEVPFEILILPRLHSADFGNISPSQTLAFAQILKEVLSRLYIKLNNPAYNYAIVTAARFKVNEPHLHWYCQIRPYLTTPAGFEMGSGIRINPSLPEADAIFLNAI
ncbi:galactose-1-phosphate uridylyltransferase, family 1 [Synechococcus sp. PCC 7502]|uniref:galactose-1-phosphate uridylyltransferase n=1 Tax=Synechococcus sp. PCC 7502 TaxID=1173263 RepID=UPI00029FBC21|nr:galactose-1-phosphate uridylyltransferase [Synechococcus sp. PCC 7502]AFY74979.1 galactose-1-phosphate uridylyltransferase, family 1 [Synechococcus sp. PCC 7502]